MAMNATTLEAYALEKGINFKWNTADNAAKAELAMKMFMDRTSQYAGNFARESEETFSGSFGAMKAAAEDTLANLALGENIQPSLQALAETTSTFLFNNFLPMVGNILMGLPGLVGGLLKEGMVKIVQQVFGDEVAQQVSTELNKIGEVIASVFDMIFGSMSRQDNIDLLTSLGFSEETAEQIVNIGENIRVTFENIGAIFGELSTLAGNVVSGLFGFSDAESVVSSLSGVLEKVTGFLREASEKLKDFTTWLNSGTPAADAFQAAVVGVGTAFATWKIASLLNDLGGLSGILTTLSGGLTGFAATVTTAISSIPIIGWIAAAVAGLVWFFTQTETGKEMWNNFVEWAQGLWDGVKEYFSNLWTSISETASGIWDGVVSAWNGVVATVTGVWNGIVEFFSNLWTGIQTAASTAWNMLVQAIMTVVQPFIDTFMQYWTSMSDGLSQMWEGIKMIFQGAWDFIKALFMGVILVIIDLVTGNFGQLKEDLGLIWESIKEAVSLVWEGIKTFFSGVIEAIVSFATTHFENFKAFLSGLWEGIKSAASGAWEWLKETVSNLITGLIEWATNTWNNFTSFLSNLWENIKSGAINAWENLKTSVQEKIDNIVSGAKRAWEDLKRSVQEAVDRVKSIFDGIKKIDLFGAGKAILDGFLRGLRNAWQGVTNFVGGIADWIRKNKGPIEYDRKLLIPAGRAIMGGFDASLQDSFKQVQATVKSMAPSLAASFGEEPIDFGVTKDVEHQLHQTSFSSGAFEVETQADTIGYLQSMVGLLGELLEKDSAVYLDGEALAKDSFGRHAQMMERMAW